MSEAMTLAQAHALPSGNYRNPERTNLDDSDIAIVDMYVIAITDAKSDRPILGTNALDTCTAVIVHNKKNKSVGVAHVDHHPADALLTLISHLRSNATDLLEVHVLGMNVYNEMDKIMFNGQALDLLNTLAGISNATLKTFDLGVKPHPHGAMLDTRNGALYRLGRDIVSAEEVDYETEIDIGFPLELAYEHGIHNFHDLTQKGIPTQRHRR